MICFTNPGVLDLRCLRAFGVNVKPLTTNPIGAFGSGLKVAISILLRTRHRITLWRGLNRYTFRTKPVDIRGKTFDFVVLCHPDGTEEEMAYNTHVGEHWPDAGPFRELHSNALDEGGGTSRIDTYTPRADQTAFLVEGEEIERSYNQRDLIFLPSSPILSTDKLDIHHGRSEYAYYRGAQVYKLPRPSLYTYNLRELTWGLTEDRTLKDACDLAWRIAEAVARVTDETFLNAVLTAPEAAFEHTVTSSWAEDPSEAFVGVYRKLREDGHAADLTSLANGTYLRKHKTLPLPPPIELTRIQRLQLDKAVSFCKRAGWTVDEYPIVVVPHAHGGMLALAEDGKIVLTARLFDMGVAEVVNALVEEYTHLRFGLRDMTREMQTHLFRQLVCAKQEVLGEAL